MQKRLDRGYKPKEPVEGPNVWRVMTGDRIIWIGGVEAHDNNPAHTLVAFGHNALVFGERRIHAGDLASFLSFGPPIENSPSDKLVSLLRRGLDDVRELGLPREIPEIGSDWHLGS